MVAVGTGSQRQPGMFPVSCHCASSGLCWQEGTQVAAQVGWGLTGKNLPWITGDEGLEKPVPCLKHTLDLFWRWVSLKRLDGENFRNVSFFFFS